MAIRIREINGRLLALCAAATNPEPNDVYLDDACHHALGAKFALDFAFMDFIKGKVPVNWKDRRDIKRLETSRIVSKP